MGKKMWWFLVVVLIAVGAPRGRSQHQAGDNDSGNITIFIGQNQGNSGNTGYNRGSIMDNTRNDGNMIIN